MKLRWKLVAGTLLGLALLLLVRRCDRPDITPTEPGALLSVEKEHITVGNHIITVVQPEKTVTEYVPGRADVSVRKDGQVVVRVREFGFCLEPGFGGAYNGIAGKEVVDVKFLYYHRLGLDGGITLDFGKGVKAVDIAKPLVTVSYVPLSRFANTSVFIGTELFPQRLIGGLRLAF